MPVPPLALTAVSEAGAAVLAVDGAEGRRAAAAGATVAAGSRRRPVAGSELACPTQGRAPVGGADANELGRAAPGALLVGAGAVRCAQCIWCLEWQLPALCAWLVGVGVAVAGAMRLASEAERRRPWTCGPDINRCYHSGNKILRVLKPHLYRIASGTPYTSQRQHAHTKVRVV